MAIINYGIGIGGIGDRGIGIDRNIGIGIGS